MSWLLYNLNVLHRIAKSNLNKCEIAEMLITRTEMKHGNQRESH